MFSLCIRGCAVFWEIKNRLLHPLLQYNGRTVLYQYNDNTNLLFVYGFEVCILPKCCMMYEEFTHKDGVLNSQNEV